MNVSAARTRAVGAAPEGLQLNSLKGIHHSFHTKIPQTLHVYILQLQVIGKKGMDNLVGQKNSFVLRSFIIFWLVYFEETGIIDTLNPVGAE